MSLIKWHELPRCEGRSVCGGGSRVPDRDVRMRLGSGCGLVPPGGVCALRWLLPGLEWKIGGNCQVPDLNPCIHDVLLCCIYIYICVRLFNVSTQCFTQPGTTCTAFTGIAHSQRPRRFSGKGLLHEGVSEWEDTMNPNSRPGILYFTWRLTNNAI